MSVQVENRATFFARLEPFLAPSALLDIQLAYTLAKYGHRAQVRKELDPQGKPVRYFEHVRRVVIILIDEVKVIDPVMIIAGIQHDGPEDTEDLTPPMIEHCFGSDVTQVIKVLSKTPPEGYIQRFHMCTDWRPFVLKGCDRLDNLRSLPGTSTAFRAKQVAETREKYCPLLDRMMQLVPPAFKERAQWLRDAVVIETERQATFLELST
jgi:guanosine-3',5'-bis(diphosphate) 3'-pyrophosphohydrolase